MSTVDEILASGGYCDRRGRLWEMCKVPQCKQLGSWWGYGGPVETDRHVTRDQMRLLIERDQHECVGLGRCLEHPVVSVRRHADTGLWLVFADNWGIECIGPEYHEWSDAMSAARALAVGE